MADIQLLPIILKILAAKRDKGLSFTYLERLVSRDEV
jgi:cyanate lyase